MSKHYDELVTSYFMFLMRSSIWQLKHIAVRVPELSSAAQEAWQMFLAWGED